jgi:hypothetical protein
MDVSGLHAGACEAHGRDCLQGPVELMDVYGLQEPTDVSGLQEPAQLLVYSRS